MKRSVCIVFISILLLDISKCQNPDKHNLHVKNIYWGDLHNHCSVGYAKGSLERAYDIAKSHLDFYCFTPHSQWHDQPDNVNLEKFTKAYEYVRESWDKLKEYANEANKPGEFVSFIGYEWHSSSYGDLCLILPRDEGVLLYCDNIKDLQQFALENNAILIPHHPAYLKGIRGLNREVLQDIDISPVVELFSEHGNAESDRAPFPYIRHSMGGRYTRSTVQYLWEMGYRLGVVASTDDHLGYPGAYGEGMAAVYADTLTRERIMEAIKARRTYAVNADRIELDFRLNNHWMGEILTDTSTRNIYVKVKGKGEIDRIEVLRNNKVIHRNHPVDKNNSVESWKKPVLCRIEFGWGPWGGFNIQKVADWEIDIKVNKGTLISASPCFQSGPYEETRRNKITYMDSNNCKLMSYTSRKEAFEEKATNSVILELLGSPNTEITLLLSQPVKMEFKKTLADLTKSNDIFFTGGMGSESVMLHRIVFYENYCAEFSFSDHRKSENADWYYVRVIQSNESMAWSSPVWIEKKEIKQLSVY